MYNKLMLRSYKSSLLVLPAILLAGLYINTNVFADSNDVDFSITVNPSLTLSLSSNAVNFSITPTAQGAYNSANFTVTSATNNAYGYTLVMGTSDVNLTSSTINPVTTEYPTIPTLEETQDGISAADFEASTDSNVLNHYGVAIGTGNNFNAMKTTNPIKKTTVNNASGVDTTTIALASKLDLNTVPGTYSTTINFQMTANPVPGGLEEAYQNAGKTKKTIGGKEYYAMQDMNSTICSNATVEDDQIQVYDNRDDKIYWIAKLKDGHCWMTQNLDHNIVTTAGYYTHDNTDLGWGSDKTTTTWKPTRATIPTTDISSTGSISGWTNDHNTPYSVDTGDWYWTDTWYTSTTNNYLNIDGSGAGDKFSQTPYTSNGTHGHVGNYYNWSAAVASNDTSSYDNAYGSSYSDIAKNPQNSICPAGWRLPIVTSYTSDQQGNNDFYNLVNKYGNVTNTDSYITANPLYFVRSGNVGSGSLLSSGYGGYYWSSTVYSRSNAYLLYFHSGNIAPTFNNFRYYGESLRCIAR